MMQWKRDPNMKCTDMCIYIDENMEKLREPGKYPREENTIYNYLWLLVKALAIKKRMFNNFQDYDGYAFYSANRLFFALRKNLENTGKIIKGKEIRPIKSCLNYTKALLYPMKLEYLKEAYAFEANADTIDKKFDLFAFREKLKENINDNVGANEEFMSGVKVLFSRFDYFITEALKKCPFEIGTIDYKKLKISLLMNCLNNLKNGKGIDFDPVTIQLWKLPKSMASYVRVLLKELGADLKVEIMSYYSSTRIDDNILNYMLSNPEGDFIDHENQY